MNTCPKCNETVKGKARFCPSCGEKIGRRSAHEKKARLTGEKKSPKALFAAIGALVLVGALAFGAAALMKSPGTGGSAAAFTEAAGELTFPVSSFDDGRPKYYSYQAPNGRTVKFFILKSSDGIVRAAFDACDVCYQSRKGYRQEGDFMVCNNCGQRFQSTRINEIRGGCNPAPLDRRIEGTSLTVAVADVLAGQRYF